MPQPQTRPMTPIVARLIAAAGSQAKLAQHLGVSRQAICMWERVPAKWVGRISALSGIPPHDLRADLFPAPAEQAST